MILICKFKIYYLNFKRKSKDACWKRGLQHKFNKIGQKNCWSMSIKLFTKGDNLIGGSYPSKVRL